MPTNKKPARNRITLSMQSLISSLDDQESFMHALAELHVGGDSYRLARYGAYVEDGLLYEEPINKELIVTWAKKFGDLAMALGIELEINESFVPQEEGGECDHCHEETTDRDPLNGMWLCENCVRDDAAKRRGEE